MFNNKNSFTNQGVYCVQQLSTNDNHLNTDFWFKTGAINNVMGFNLFVKDHPPLTWTVV